MAIITTAPDIQEIRELVSRRFTSNELSDNQISADIYLGVATREILGRKRITEAQYNALDPDEQLKIVTAIKYQTAIELLSNASETLRETIIGITRVFDRLTIAEKIKRYEEIIERQLDGTTNSDNEALSFVGLLPGRE